MRGPAPYPTRAAGDSSHRTADESAGARAECAVNQTLLGIGRRKPSRATSAAATAATEIRRFI